MKEIMNITFWPVVIAFVPTLLVARPSQAQGAPPAPPGGGNPSGTPAGNSGGTAPPAGGAMVTTPGAAGTAPGATPPGLPPGSAIYVPPYGVPLGPTTNPHTHLPSSSQPSSDTSRASDNFDFAPGRGGPSVLRGNANGAFSGPGPVDSTERLPPVYTVRRGDTLWDLCDRYFHNPWDWPRVWSYNPELQNPHWIYPGDQIRMEPAAPSGQENALAPPGGRRNGGLSRFVGRQVQVQPNTVFLRDQGYIDDDVKDVWGEVSGSPDDQLLLSEGDNAYLDLKPGHDVQIGQELTVFRPIKSTLRGDAKGSLVAILGTARVEKWDPATRVARAKLTESLDVIGRGAFVGPVGRRFAVVPPVRNETDLWGHVAASIYPHVLYGQNQVVFIDRGQQAGLVPGNRLFVVSRGDAYRKTLLGASEFATAEVHYENEKPAVIEKGGVLGRGDDSKYPDEVVGEIRVLSVRDHTAACLVTVSNREIEPGQSVVARKGY
jgi:hypothetical protein